LVPDVVNKLCLVDNSLKDENLAKIFHGLSMTKGLRVITIIGNGIGNASYDSMAHHLIKSSGVKELRKLIFKAPNPPK
jgi:purine-nucleoside phosphorylase